MDNKTERYIALHLSHSLGVIRRYTVISQTLNPLQHQFPNTYHAQATILTSERSIVKVTTPTETQVTGVNKTACQGVKHSYE